MPNETIKCDCGAEIDPHGAALNGAGTAALCWLCGRFVPLATPTQPAQQDADAATEKTRATPNGPPAAVSPEPSHRPDLQPWSPAIGSAAVVLLLLGVLLWALNATPRTRPGNASASIAGAADIGADVPGGDAAAIGSHHASREQDLQQGGGASGRAGDGGQLNGDEQGGAQSTGPVRPQPAVSTNSSSAVTDSASGRDPSKGVSPTGTTRVNDDVRVGFSSDAVKVDPATQAALALGQDPRKSTRAGSGTAAGSGTGAGHVGLFAWRGEAGRNNGRSFGASDGSESAVDLGLQWLAKVQDKDGHWSSHGNYPDSNTSDDYATGYTALATLAFLGAGHTHRAEGPYRDQVARAVRWLTRRMSEAGRFDMLKFYEQGFAATALCEAFGMTADPALRVPCQAATDYIVSQMGPTGGFGYNGPGDDTHVTSAQVMAIKSALLAGLNVPDGVTHRFLTYYDARLNPNGKTRYRMDHESPVTAARTAVGLYCRVMLGRSPGHEDAVKIARLLDDTGPKLDDVFQTYYGTYAMFQMQDSYWKGWNERFRDGVVAQQIKDQGPLTGSWPAKGIGRVGGTALNVMALEVYYRYLPINTPD